MIIKQQKDIRFINDCGCIVDENELSSAILWYQRIIISDFVVSKRTNNAHKTYLYAWFLSCRFYS